MNKLLSILCTLIILVACKNSSNKEDETEVVSNKTKSLMAIFAHPDDEIVISPLLTKYANEGVTINLVFVTDGSKGVAEHANIPVGDSLAKVRMEEALCVTKTLGINPPIFLKYTDGDLALYENLYALDDKIDSLFTKHNPNVVITFGPGGEYGHSDHRIVSNIVTEVFQREASETLNHLLFYGFPKEAQADDLKLKSKVGNWFNENWKTTQKRFLTHRIPFNENELTIAHKGASCHKSQYTPDTIDDLFTIMKQTDSAIYLRSWNGSKTLKDNIFD
ncbi:PIG-L family deacetylase [Algibacter amylolyticus]|uniref:PIG-L family deacetylase n=1 Tax=Algibacter amylolyticus TaxID=1608400 RepID=A0A5M7BA18_9FLAO|nr:PIG-L family deacetylase [Algibacter amylolyticus]KAA5825087.1 PIG-L family deacetylase [Algibacter amylolyticus]MBB5268807.1 LmbE family N-acetylglucosaminyl deacetylase [Algibacter amylolyticus]TSJ77581.1 PIG-L family deacetylase [Algibacter amylolyticus]